MNRRRIHPVAIAASAGYGKTEILCMRLLAVLLADPGNVSRTAAMTFTRAAAGEILERMFMLAANGAADDAGFADFKRKLAELSGESCFQDLTREELSGLLMRLSRRAGELTVSTIDSFMVSLAGAYALELGFFGTPSVVGEDQEKNITAELLRELLAAPSQDILDLCRENAIGKESRAFFKNCTELMENLAAARDLQTDAEAWGRIPGVTPTPRDDLADALKRCDENPPIEWDTYAERLRPTLVRCAEIASAKDNFTQEEKKVLDAFFKGWDRFPEGPAGFKGSGQKKWNFANCADDIRLLMSRARNILLIQSAVRTRAAYDLLTRCDELYRRRLWDRGLVQFKDLPKLLSNIPEEDLNDLQYRLNLQFRHFLFDEFQDTSRQQWQVFAPIAQDNGDGDHSVTFVGDVKQAIYGWRGGDSRLMGEATAGLPKRELRYSFRSGKAICDTLNILFDGGLKACPAIPEPVRTRWAAEFPLHQPFKDKPGCFTVLSCMKQPGTADFAETAAAIIADRLRQLKIRERRLECAILVRNNDQGADLKSVLAAMNGFSAEDFVLESNETIAADRVNRGLLALLYYLQHPADTESRELIRMDPALSTLLPESAAAFADKNARLAELGLSGFLDDCLRQIAAKAENAPGEAAEALLEAAREYEASSPECDTADFRDFAQNRRKRDVNFSGKVRIMTVHHSKGLTFDATFVPFFPTHPARAEHFRKVDTSGVLSGPDWLLNDVGAAALTVPALKDAIDERGYDRKFELLCNLYVALTRARYEVCAILPEMSFSKTSGKCRNFHPDTCLLGKFPGRRRIAELDPDTYYPEDLLHDVFFFDDAAFPVDSPLPVKTGPGYRVLRRTFGDREWAAEVTAPPVAPPAELFPLPAGKAVPPRPIRVAPSRTADAGPFRFPSRTGSTSSGTTFGTAVHAFFEGIADIGTFTPPAGTPPEILRHFQVCRSDPEIRELLSADGFEIWRERRFDIILNEDGVKKFVSGCFDRVRIRRGADGNAVAVDIIDFKSNDVDASGIPEAVEHYRPQMEIYARVLARLLELSPDAIAAYLVFTKTGTVCRV